MSFITTSNSSLVQWIMVDSEELHAADNMAMDRDALEKMNAGVIEGPILRFFNYVEPCVTYGYLLDPEKVAVWANGFGTIPFVKRPTGGGSVYHDKEDLSLSLLWKRRKNILPEKPRDCYETLHKIFMEALSSALGENEFRLFMKPAGCCDAPGSDDSPTEGKRFSVCYQEPVCNDIMLEGKKVIGGALRLMRNANLYQGNIHLGENWDQSKFKNILSQRFSTGPFPFSS